MAERDLPSGGSGSPPSAAAEARSRKRKRGDADVATPPRRATRSTAAGLADVDSAVRWARRAAAGAARGRNRGLDVDEERMGAVILAVRDARSELKPDDPHTPYAKKRILRQGTRRSGRLSGDLTRLPSYLSSTRKHIGIDPVKYQASVPEWENAPSENDKSDYKTDGETLQKMGTMIMLPFSVEPRKTRKAVNDKCKCSHPGSEACVQVHVKEARGRVRSQMGEKAFRNCGFDAMGEQVLKLWTAADKKKLSDIEKSIPPYKHETFIEIASKQFSSKRTTDLAKYYYNVFLPRRLARLTRAEATHAIDLSTDDEDNEHCSEQKSGKFQSSSKRSMK